MERIVPYNHSSKIEAKDLESFFANAPKLEEGDSFIFINELSELRLKAEARE